MQQTEHKQEGTGSVKIITLVSEIGSAFHPWNRGAITGEHSIQSCSSRNGQPLYAELLGQRLPKFTLERVQTPHR